MLSIRNLAREFGFTERSVRRWVADGLIPFTKCGNRVYISPAWVREKLEKYGTLEPTNPAQEKQEEVLLCKPK